MPDVVALSLPALARRMGESGVAVAGALRAERIGRGQSNLTYLLHDEGGGRWVARRPPLGELLASAHDVRRESRIMAALAPTPVPVPGVVGCFADEAIADVPVAVLEYIPGLVVDRREVADELGPAVRHGLGACLGPTLAAVHAVDLAERGLLDLAGHGPYAHRQVKRWSRQWEASRTRDLPALDKLTELLTRTAPRQHELRLVHGDFHVRNVIADPGSGRIRAVLDWELCTLGDPMADIGSLLAYWPEPADPDPGYFSASLLPGFPGRAELADSYLRASGRDAATLDYWHVLGLWKIAIIAEGVLRRTIDEPRNTAEGGGPRVEHIDGLVDRAWRLVADAGLDAPSPRGRP